MPGFIQSIKSRLPQSPFSPPKQSASVLPSVDSADPVEEVAEPEEQPTAELLPAEALIAPNSSTVALTLIPVNGVSSQQPSDDPDIAESAPQAEESITELGSSAAEPEAVAPIAEELPALAEAELVAFVPTVVDAEVPAATPLSDVIEEPAFPEIVATDASPAAIAVEPASVPPPIDLPTTDDCTTQEVLTEPATPSEAVKPVALDLKRSISRKEPPVYDPAELSPVVVTPIDDLPVAALPILQVEGVTTDAEPLKEVCTPDVKEGKQKKKRFMMSPLKKSFSSNNSTDGNSTDESATAKPKKHQPLAGRFKQVLGQVKSKVKKDKDSDKCLPEPLSDNAALSDDGGSSDNGPRSDIASPSEEISTSIDPIDAVVSNPSDNAVTA